MFCTAWLRVIKAAINNGTAGAVGDFCNGPLMFWLRARVNDFTSLSPCKQTTLFSLTSSLISGQFLASPEALVSRMLSGSESVSLQEMWTSERCNLMSFCIIYVFTSSESIKRFLLQSKSFDMLNGLLSPQRTLSSTEIVSLCGFLGALFGALQESVPDEMKNSSQESHGMVVFLEDVVLRLCEVGLLEWPLGHINDLSMLLSKAARGNSILKPLIWTLFNPTAPKNLLTTRLFPPSTSTPTELSALSQDYPQALTAACKNYRPKNLRVFLKGVAETCRRRRGKTADE